MEYLNYTEHQIGTNQGELDTRSHNGFVTKTNNLAKPKSNNAQQNLESEKSI